MLRWSRKYPQGATKSPTSKGQMVTNLITISEAATRLGVTPFDVIRLMDAGQLPRVTLVDESAVDAIRGEVSA